MHQRQHSGQLYGQLQGAARHRPASQVDRQRRQPHAAEANQRGDHRRVPHYRRRVRQEELAVAVENAQAPGREHQQARAGKQNLHQPDGQLTLGAMESRRNRVNQVGRQQRAGGNQDRRA